MMTRLFYGSTILAGLCAMTLVVGCGGSSGKKVTCDGGACTDAKRDGGDAGNKTDGPAVTRTDGPAVTPTDGPAVTPTDGPAVTPTDGPAVTPTDGPAVDAPAVTPLDAPVDGPPVDGQAGNPDVRLPDVAPATDVRVPDSAIPDTAHDTSAPDAGADAPLDVGPDSPVDAAAPDAALDAGDGGGCEGDACHEYTFEGSGLDGGLPGGFTALGGTGTWDLVMDGSNVVLQGTSAGATSFAEANLPPATSTDQTIEVNVRFLAAGAGNFVRICGRLNAGTNDAYCLEVSTEAGDAGSTSGTMTIDQHGGGSISTPPTPVTNLDIMVGEWHTYRFSISGAGPVTLQGYFDGALKVSGSDNPASFTNGTVALGVRGLTADFDNLIVTTP
jgi:hypothetical protein